MRSPILAPLITAALAVALAACGDDAESAAETAPARPADPATEPWERIPPDSLYGATASENLRVVPAILDALRIPAEWEGMRIAAISDLRLGLWPDNEEVAAAAVRTAVEEDPDLVVLLGDYAESIADTAALARVLEPLRGQQVLAVLGDRDVRTDSLEAAITRTLGDAGVRVLDNDAASITYGGGTASIGGLDPDLVDSGFGDRQFVLSTLGDGANTPIVLTHNPLLAAAAPDDRFDAVLAGNTFCGDVEVPGTPRLSWLRREALPAAAVPEVDRLFRIDGNTLFVTCGTGYSFVPVRAGAPPEVALITLESVRPTSSGTTPDSAAVPDSLLQRFQNADTTAADTAS